MVCFMCQVHRCCIDAGPLVVGCGKIAKILQLQLHTQRTAKILLSNTCAAPRFIQLAQYYFSRKNHTIVVAGK